MVHTFISPTTLVVSILAVWRVSHLLSAEDGPGDVLVRLRRRLGEGLLGRLLDCFYCLSLWVAALVAWMVASGQGWRAGVLLWLGLSGGAIVLVLLPDRAGRLEAQHRQLRRTPYVLQPDALLVHGLGLKRRGRPDERPSLVMRPRPGERIIAAIRARRSRFRADVAGRFEAVVERRSAARLRIRRRG